MKNFLPSGGRWIAFGAASCLCRLHETVGFCFRSVVMFFLIAYGLIG